MRKYLVVDDNLALAENLAEILRDSGAEATVARATDAVQLATAHRYDLLITDMKMPHLSGLELVRRLHLVDPELPAILITAYTGDGDLDPEICCELLAVLPKPVPIARLLQLAALAARAHP